MPLVAMIRKPSSSSRRDRLDDLRLVAVADRNEHRAAGRHRAAGAELALGEGDGVVAVEAHGLAGRAHLGAEQRVDAGEAGEREHRLLDRDVVVARSRFRSKPASGSPAMTSAPILANGVPIGLGDERHGARGARVDLEDVDVAVLDGVLDVHQPLDR